MNIVILGNGGHSKVVQDIIACDGDQKIVAILDDKYEFMTRVNGILYAPLFYVHRIIQWDVRIVLAIGDNETRRMFSRKLDVAPNQYLTVIHPTAVVSPTAVIGNGTVVMPHALINAGSIVGDHCIINTGSIVEHDNIIGNYAHISPNATCTGNVAIGVGVHIGASATIIPSVNIGHWSVVGAGSTVIEDVPAHSTAVGSPTRLLDNKSNEKTREKVVVLYEET